MFYFVILVLGGLLWLVGFGGFKLAEEVDSESLAITSFVVGLVGAIAFLVVGVGVNFGYQLGSYTNHIAQQEYAEKLREVIDIRTNRQEKLSSELTNLLAKIYPEHELGVFGSLRALVAHYPEIGADETALKLSEEIKQMEDLVVEAREEREQVLMLLRTRERSPWVWIPLPDNK